MGSLSLNREGNIQNTLEKIDFDSPGRNPDFDKIFWMSFPIKTCVVCGEEFELRPDKPGFANRCPECSSSEAEEGTGKHAMSAEERKALNEVNEERRKVIRDMLYRKDS